MFKKEIKTNWSRLYSVDVEHTLLTFTFVLILRLIEQLLKQFEFCICLNNLFLNISVIQCLLTIKIYYMNTTYKKIDGFFLHF